MKDVILLSGSTQIVLSDDAVSHRASIVAASSIVTEITNSFDMECAIDAMRELKECLALVEKSRVDVKSPVLDWGRKIDSMAKAYVAPIESETARLKKLMDTYAADQRRKADEAERVRQSELKRIADERFTAMQAELKAQEDARRAERERLEAANAQLVAFDEAERLAARNEADAQESARKKAESDAGIERMRLAELEVQRRQQMVPAVAPARPEGLITREVPKFEVVNIDELYIHNPAFCRIEANTAAINAVIRSGTREIAGLRIWIETETGVRR